MAHILNEDFLEAHASHDLLIDIDGLVALWGGLMLGVLKKALGEEIILNSLIMVVHRQYLLLFAHVLAPAAAASATCTTSYGRIHSEELLDAHGRDALVWHELDQR